VDAAGRKPVEEEDLDWTGFLGRTVAGEKGRKALEESRESDLSVPPLKKDVRAAVRG
jgi:hypothetical protein